MRRPSGDPSSPSTRMRRPRRGARVAMGRLRAAVTALESHRARDRVMRAAGYVSELAGGVLAELGRPEASRRLLLLSAQLAQCRTVLRLLDGPAMLLYVREYGLGPPDEDAPTRALQVLANAADQLYYPSEHVAWAADAGLLGLEPAPWWALSAALWLCSLLLGAARAAWTMLKLSRKLRACRAEPAGTRERAHAASVSRALRAELLTLLSNMADAALALHAQPRGPWRLPPWLSGLLGTASSLLGACQA
ncbi:peroxisomal membrane protein 11C isoform X1 [Meriones unguiculatus]|uniref:peroxisomal membrane protein 11C isoform X1 n=1 Tax=Meriones unguiculatus TaxID=10047 RepID=UPI00293EE1CF|nr:peroxisomal membrane protein 11C isoform X1 [Meriones unguiculatus]